MKKGDTISLKEPKQKKRKGKKKTAEEGKKKGKAVGESSKGEEGKEEGERGTGLLALVWGRV